MVSARGRPGTRPSAVHLGTKYEGGFSVPQDDAEAVLWYRLAANQGDARAQGRLGFMYRHGRGVPQDSAEAVRWFRLSADNGKRQRAVRRVPEWTPTP